MKSSNVPSTPQSTHAAITSAAQRRSGYKKSTFLGNISAHRFGKTLSLRDVRQFFAAVRSIVDCPFDGRVGAIDGDVVLSLDVTARSDRPQRTGRAQAQAPPTNGHRPIHKRRWLLSALRRAAPKRTSVALDPAITHARHAAQTATPPIEVTDAQWVDANACIGRLRAIDGADEGLAGPAVQRLAVSHRSTPHGSEKAVLLVYARLACGIPVDYNDVTEAAGSLTDGIVSTDPTILAGAAGTTLIPLSEEDEAASLHKQCPLQLLFNVRNNS